MNRLRIILAVLLVAAQMTSGAVASGLVLCVGDGGHVAVEPAHAQCDHSAAQSSEPVGHEPRSWLEKFDPTCHDLPLGVNDWPMVIRPQDGQHNHAIDHQPALWTASALPPAISGYGSRLASEQATFAHDVVRDSLRTVVLTV